MDREISRSWLLLIAALAWFYSRSLPFLVICENSLLFNSNTTSVINPMQA